MSDHNDHPVAEDHKETEEVPDNALGKRERPSEFDMSVDDDLPFKRPKHADLPKDLQNRPIRVYVDGIFDLFHFGHAKALEQAKKIFPPERTYLLVGCCGDRLTHTLKGKTVMNEGERYESLRHCKWVDEVIEDAPWFITQEFIDEHKIDFVAHGNDAIVDASGNDVYKFVKDQGKFVNFRRTDGISTTDLIMRIVRDYDSYVRRNLKRGYKPVDMNVPFFRAKQIEMGEKFDEFKAKFKKVKENFVRDFMKRFGAILQEIDMSGNSSSDEYGSDFDAHDGFDYEKLLLEEEEDKRHTSAPLLLPPSPTSSSSSSSSSSSNIFGNHH